MSRDEKVTYFESPHVEGSLPGLGGVASGGKELS